MTGCKSNSRLGVSRSNGMHAQQLYTKVVGLSDVDLSTRAWYLVYDVRLLLDGERVFDLSTCN